MLQTVLEKMTGVKVLVVGDVMLDHYIWGDVHRISPEAPVPVVHAERDTYTAGGAANVALNLSNLGAATTLLGYIGQDEAGNRLQHILHEKKVLIAGTHRGRPTPTIIKTRVIVRGQQLCRIDREAAPVHYNIYQQDFFADTLPEALQNTDAVILSDYAKGVVTQPLVDAILRYAKQHRQLLVAVDPKPSRLLNFTGAGLLTPNRTEALQMAGMAEPYPGTPYPLQQVCAAIQERHQPQQLIITLGAEGMAICQQGKVVQQLPTEAREVFDVSGAGDTVIAALTAALAAGAGITDAARLANAAAACVVSHVGTVPVAKAELLEKLKSS